MVTYSFLDYLSIDFWLVMWIFCLVSWFIYQLTSVAPGRCNKFLTSSFHEVKAFLA